MDDTGSPLLTDLQNDSRVESELAPTRLDPYRPTPRRHEKPESASLKPPLGIVAASVCGLLAAILYTAANVALRRCVGLDPFLVSAVKAAPTVLLLTPLVVWMRFRGDTIATSGRMIPKFIVASLLGQFIGNGMFQVALGVIGLAASVPIMLGVLIIGSAVLGHIVLGEPVRVRTIVAIVTLIAAVIVLSLPGATTTPSASMTQLPIWVGALCAAASGAAYAWYGVVMRQTLNGGVSAPATMLISGIAGTISLWSAALMRVGLGELAEIPTELWYVMAAAGLFNFTAFTALTLSLKTLPIVAVNSINATQVAMAAVAGVLLFAEPVTAPLVIGITLTLAGLTMLANRRGRKLSAASGIVSRSAG